MKITPCLVLASALFFAGPAAQAQVKEPNEMVRKIFAALQSKDEKAFVALYPNATQFSTLMRNMMTQMLNTPEMKQVMAADPNAKNMNIDSMITAEVSKMSDPEAFGQMQKKFSASFQEVIAKGEKKGVNWSDAKLTNITVDTAAVMDGDMAALKATGIKAMDGVIDFRSGTTDYQMSFNKVMYIPSEGGWFGGEFPQLARKGESLKPDTASSDDEKVMAETEAAAGETKTKAKAKTATGQTKTKTKTSAGKTTTKTKTKA